MNHPLHAATEMQKPCQSSVPDCALSLSPYQEEKENPPTDLLPLRRQTRLSVAAAPRPPAARDLFARSTSGKSPSEDRWWWPCCVVFSWWWGLFFVNACLFFPWTRTWGSGYPPCPCSARLLPFTPRGALHDDTRVAGNTLWGGSCQLHGHKAVLGRG